MHKTKPPIPAPTDSPFAATINMDQAPPIPAPTDSPVVIATIMNMDQVFVELVITGIEESSKTRFDKLYHTYDPVTERISMEFSFTDGEGWVLLLTKDDFLAHAKRTALQWT